MSKDAIRQLIERSYLQGALNEMQTERMPEAYHPDFAIFFPAAKGELGKLPLKPWIDLIEKDKSKGIDRIALRQLEAEFLQIEVSGQAAFVKLRLLRKGTPIFTDFITLLNMEGRWQIVTKIYDQHVEDPWQLA
ncbi:MAG: nuclear transport factor 2 family protein [Saprospiraceae bacterium]|nr:nuclear transport factor 2 family protein [Saprospiraceae bacterium]